MSKLLNLALQIAITLAVIAAALAVIEALKRRGFDPVGRVAAFLSPPSEELINGDY